MKLATPSRREIAERCLKTSLCKFYLAGACQRGPCCRFAHGEQELRAIPDISLGENRNSNPGVELEGNVRATINHKLIPSRLQNHETAPLLLGRIGPESQGCKSASALRTGTDFVPEPFMPAKRILLTAPCFPASNCLQAGFHQNLVSDCKRSATISIEPAIAPCEQLATALNADAYTQTDTDISHQAAWDCTLCGACHHALHEIKAELKQLKLEYSKALQVIESVCQVKQQMVKTESSAETTATETEAALYKQSSWFSCHSNPETAELVNFSYNRGAITKPSEDRFGVEQTTRFERSPVHWDSFASREAVPGIYTSEDAAFADIDYDCDIDSSFGRDSSPESDFRPAFGKQISVHSSKASGSSCVRRKRSSRISTLRFRCDAEFGLMKDPSTSCHVNLTSKSPECNGTSNGQVSVGRGPAFGLHMYSEPARRHHRLTRRPQRSAKSGKSSSIVEQFEPLGMVKLCVKNTFVDIDEPMHCALYRSNSAPASSGKLDAIEG